MSTHACAPRKEREVFGALERRDEEKMRYNNNNMLSDAVVLIMYAPTCVYRRAFLLVRFGSERKPRPTGRDAHR